MTIYLMPIGEPTLKLGTIQERLGGLPITAANLADLGFVAIQKGASKLYHDESFPAMCDAVSMAAQKAKTEYLEAL